MIGIGINENVILAGVTITEKDGKISTDFKLSSDVVDSSEGVEYDLEDKYDEQGNVITSGGKGTVVKVWPVSIPKEESNGKSYSIAERVNTVLEALKEQQNFFTAWARCYVTTDKLVGVFQRFQGLTLTKDNISSVLDEQVTAAVLRNLTNQFVALVGPHLNKSEFKVRLLLKRQSEAKAFPSFRDKFITSFPFVEPMSGIPKEASKIAFTKYELDKKLDSSAPAATTSSSEPTADVPAESLFKIPEQAVDLNQALG